MGDRCPRLELTIPTESTSFKRSWDELGLDLSSSPNGDRSNGGEGSSSGERNKRARSESSARSVTVASSSGNLASGSSSRTASSPRRATLESHEGTASPVDLVLDEPDSVAEPMDGVEPLPSILDLSPRASPAAEQNAQFRLSMERFNAFDSNISVLRHSDSPMPGPSLPRAARTMLETALDSSSPVLEMPPTPNLNTIARSRPPTPPSPHTLMSRLSAAPPALPPVATVSGAPSWLTDFDDALRPIALDHGDDLPFQWGSRSAQSSVRSPPYIERRRDRPISPEEALRRLRDIQHSLEEYLQGTSTSLEPPSATSPMSPNLAPGMPYHHYRQHLGVDHGDAEADPLTAELSLIREAIRRLQARARQIESVQRARGDAGTGAASAVRSAWVTLTGRPENPHSVSEDREPPSSSRSTANGYDDLLSANHDPLSLAASNRFRRSLYTTRPGPSNSLMSENAAEFRSRRAREQLSSISGTASRSNVGSDLRFSPVDWGLPGVNNGRTSPIDEPRFAPADWSLPSFRGSTRASEQDSTDSRRSQTSRARPTTLEPDPFDSDYGLSHTGTELNHPQFNSLWQPLPSLSGGADPDESLDFPDLMLRRNSPPPRNAANTTAATRAASALHRAPYGALEQWLLGGPDDTASAAQTETQRPRAADANRARTVPHSDRPPRVMSYQPLSARMADADRRAQLESMASDAGVSVEELTRRGMSRLVAIRERRTATAPANRNAPRPAARPSSPGSRRAERDTEQSRSDYDLDARAELRASIAPPRIYDSPPRSTSRTVPSAASASRRPSVTGETSARTAPTVRFNVDSFHEGPFRASIQRSLELQNMTSEVTRPSSRTVPRDSGAPSLPPLRFQRLSTERLPPFRSISRSASGEWEESEYSADPTRNPYSTISLLDGPSNPHWDSLLHWTMSRDPPSTDSRSRPESTTSNGPVCPLHGVVHDGADDVDPSESDRGRESTHRPGSRALPRWRGLNASRSASSADPFPHLPPGASSSTARRPMASLWDTLSPSEAGESDGASAQSRNRNSSSQPSTGSGDTRDPTSRRTFSARARAMRRRDFDFFGMDADFPEIPRRFGLSRFGPRARPFGDYVRDEDLDTSYEALLDLSGLLGDVRPRGLSEQTIATLPSGTYREWATPGETEDRCPICLDDYNAEDAVLKVPACSHWFHRGCLEQWLKSARTCPVCRGRVGTFEYARNGPRVVNPSGPSAGPSGSVAGVFARRRRNNSTVRRGAPPEGRREGGNGNDSDSDRPPFPPPPWRLG